jgi:hypothetical protein
VHTRIIVGQEEENPLEESKSEHPRIAQGPVAAQANENPQGFQGRSGLWDAQGKKGPQGFMGAQGKECQQGFMGAQGNEGPQDFIRPYTYDQFIMQSITDVQRLMGVQSNEGRQGVVSLQTPQLTIQGSTGARGPQGPQGPTTKPREIVEHGG